MAAPLLFLPVSTVSSPLCSGLPSEEKKQLAEFLLAEVSWRAAVPDEMLRKEVNETVENAYIAIFVPT
jgi:hypothetical protein